MKITTDYHMHTPLCGHAVGEPKEYVEHALKMGLTEMGFSDHAPFFPEALPRITMKHEELPTYHQMIEEVQETYKDQIDIKVGLEADFLPNHLPEIHKMLNTYPYDYVIGSVHFINDWGFDDPNERDSWNQKDINQVYCDYYELLRQSAQTGLFDIIGHCDLVKKFGHTPSNDMHDEIVKTAKAFKDSEIAIEINTAGWHKPCQEQYPALDCLKIYAQHDIPLVFGSDAHDPTHVGRDFDKAYDLAKQAGFTHRVIFKQRLMINKIKL